MADEKRGNQTSASGPWTRRTEFSLGCGTLILIALIVWFFSGRGTDDLQRDVRELRSDVGELKKLVEAQTSQLKLLEDKLDRPEATRGGRQP